VSSAWIGALGDGVGAGAVFLFGIASSLHCLAMCGGFFLAPPAEGGEGGEGKGRKVGPYLAYNAGRLLSYALAGAAAGAFGAVASVSEGLRGAVAIVGGIVVAAIGLAGLGALRLRFRLLEAVSKPLAAGIVARGIGGGGASEGARAAKSIATGALTVLMPCAPLQAVLLLAVGRGSAPAGAAVMLAFAAGTIPALVGGGALLEGLARNPAVSRIARKAASALVLVMGLFMLSRGLAASGSLSRIARLLSFDAQLEATLPSDAAIARIEGGVQRVETRIGAASFHPIVAQKGLPLIWTIHAAPEDLNEHSSTFTIPDLGIKKEISAGDNVIGFTPPDSPGRIDYCSWCGMIKSEIFVVDDVGSLERAIANHRAIEKRKDVKE
jgi:uncharacterized protein